MANAIYNGFKKKIADGSIDLDTDTIKVMLVTSVYTPNIATHVFKSDVTNEVTGTGYTAGGTALTTKVVTQDNTNNLAYFDADDVTWAASTITARGAVLYKDTGVATTSPIICYFDFTTDQISSAGNFVITWNAAGILRLT